jgi:outer membrane protein OmpA-like peptidoglycan-associated protein
MKLRRLRHLALVGCCALPLAACSLFRSLAPPDSVSRAHAETPAQLAQLDFGRDARFARCLAPACPARTPKTLVTETPSRPAPKQPTDRAASFVPIASVVPVPTATPRVPKVQTSHTVTVPFAFGSARLDPAAQARLNNAQSDIGAVRRVTITGHTDSTGPSAVNEALALARAQAVRDYLRKSRPALAAALTVEAQGACCFVATNDTPAGRAQNRRVEVVFHTSEAVLP